VWLRRLRYVLGEVRVPSQATSKRAPEETRDRAERGSAVRGSDQRASSPKRVPSPPPWRDTQSQLDQSAQRILPVHCLAPDISDFREAVGGVGDVEVAGVQIFGELVPLQRS